MHPVFDIILVILNLVVAALLLVQILRRNSSESDDAMDESDIREITDAVRDTLMQSERAMKAELAENIRSMGESIQKLQAASAQAQSGKLNDVDRQLNQKLQDLELRMDKQIAALEKDTADRLESIRQLIDEKLQGALDERMNYFGQTLAASQKQAAEAQEKQIGEIAGKIGQNLALMNQSILEKQEQSGKSINDTLKALEVRFQTLEANNEQKLDNIRTTMSRQLTSIQEENQKKLDSIQNTVNEKLESQLQKSFRLVSEQLETVHKSLGEMQSIASGVGDLKRVLSNVKTRGILGEIQLGSILEEILAPEQYETEIATKKDSREHVEYAVKLPGSADGQTIYLPIDSKFPGDTYEQLLRAYDTGSKEAVDAAKKNLTAVIKKCARDIRDKYISPPETTNFGIMFLPFEGLYAEVVNLGLIETLQRDYSVNITGPSTMAAMLNALQMGFRTLAIQKKSSEVWEILGAVKKEFGTFQGVLDKAQKNIQTASENIDKLIGTRTRAITRKLNAVETLDDPAKSRKLLGLELTENDGEA